MVVVKNQKSALRLYFQVGLDDDGFPVYRSKTYSSVKPATTEDDLFALAGIISGLQTLPVGTINRTDQANLEQA